MDGLTALGLTAKDTEMFVDVMAATVTNSNTDIERMGGFRPFEQNR
ncbi:phage tail tape measure protein [Clostridioides difficile]|nr:phage tail tape measure protein [Clostridioides difficile]MCP8369104.1 phage tail tape measure protein [Clostridioides difficile]MCP8376167.1 phage tail tape measure protein [Clostridioides difficile]HCQ6132477.1 hypothetical protein [Clostridioides difficile]